MFHVKHSRNTAGAGRGRRLRHGRREGRGRRGIGALCHEGLAGQIGGWQGRRGQVGVAGLRSGQGCAVGRAALWAAACQTTSAVPCPLRCPACAVPCLPTCPLLPCLPPALPLMALRSPSCLCPPSCPLRALLPIPMLLPPAPACPCCVPYYLMMNRCPLLSHPIWIIALLRYHITSLKSE